MDEKRVQKVLEDLGLHIVKYKRNEFYIRCPWHDDNEASLFVNPEKGLHHCFAGCTKGTIKSLITKLGGYSGWLEVENVFKDYNLSFDNEEDYVRVIPDFGAFNINKLAIDHPYLGQRHIDNQIVTTFDIRYNTRNILIPIYSNDICYNHQECTKESYNGYHFCGYVERSLDGNKRYMYSPGLTISRHFFPNILDKQEYIILTEGIFDFFRLKQANFNALALLGINLSAYKRQILLTLTRNIVLCLDNDTTGIMATKTLKDNLYLKGVNVQCIKLEEGIKDIAEMDTISVKKLIGEKINW